MGALVVIILIGLAICYFMQIDMPFLIVGGGMIAAGFIILCSQIYGYLDLQNAKWEPKPVLGAIKDMYSEGSSVQQWAVDPQSMLGLHSFLQMMPLSAFLVLVGFLFCWYYSSR